MKYSLLRQVLVGVGWLWRSQLVDSVLVGGVLLPHGDFALDPSFFANHTEEREVANDVATGARRVGRWLAELHQKHDEEPMIVLLTTPHGIKLDYDYGIYMASKGSGTATIGGDCMGFTERGFRERHCQHKPYNVTLDIDLAPVSVANGLLTTLRGQPVSGIYSYNDDTPIPLNWGEIVPLLLLPENRTIVPLIWTFPYRRYDHSANMVPELLGIGADIMEWASQRKERIAVIVSGDLSHTHQPTGPYDYSNASAPFDEAIGVWANDPCNWEGATALLDKATRLQPDAKSCGFTGYVLWHGMMCSKASIAFKSKVYVNRNVTYYGMIAATFQAKNVDFEIQTEQ